MVSYYQPHDHSICPGYYCGRIFIPVTAPVSTVSPSFNDSASSSPWIREGNYSACGPCPWGYLANAATRVCELCHDPPSLYHWLYLVFMGLLVPWILHSFFIELNATRKRLKFPVIVAQHVSCAIETGLAFIISLLALEPRGSLYFDTCGVKELRDWYTMFFNPSIDYSQTIYCTSEAVYPLFSLPLISFGIGLGLLLVLRLVGIRVVRCFLRPVSKFQVSGPVYAALFFYPILAVSHVILGGVIYYSFPYLLLLVGLITNAAYLAILQNNAELLASILDDPLISQSQNTFLITIKYIGKSPAHLCVLAVHAVIFAFGITAITKFSDPLVHGLNLLWILLPTTFFLLAINVSNPKNLDIMRRPDGL